MFKQLLISLVVLAIVGGSAETSGAARRRLGTVKNDPVRLKTQRMAMTVAVVSGRDAKPVRGARVRVARLNGRRRARATRRRTNSAGLVTIRSRPGRYRIVARHLGMGRARAIMSVTAGQSATVTLHLRGRHSHHAHQHYRLGVRHAKTSTPAPAAPTAPLRHEEQPGVHH